MLAVEFADWLYLAIQCKGGAQGGEERCDLELLHHMCKYLHLMHREFIHKPVATPGMPDRTEQRSSWEDP